MAKKRNMDTRIKKMIRSNNSKNKKLAKNLMRNLNELQDCTISVAGLEDLSKSSIQKIQQKRNLRLHKLRKMMMQLNSFQKKTTMLEKKIMTKTEGN